MKAVTEDPRKRQGKFAIVHDNLAGKKGLSVGISPEDVPELVAAFAKAGRVANGYAIEAFMIGLSEINDPPWASELEFDSEASHCVVRCSRGEPLRRLLERLTRRLANRAATRRTIVGLPRE